MKEQSIFNSGRTDLTPGLITMADFNAQKQIAIDTQPITKQIRLSEIAITEESVRNNFIIINKKLVAVEKSFFRGLGKILKITSGLENSLIKEDADNSVQFYTKLVGALKAFKQNTKNDVLTLIANPQTHSITNIISKDYKRITNEGLFETAERLLNDYPTLSLYDIKTDNGDAGIKLLASGQTDFGKSNGPDGGVELFQFGMNLENSGLSTKTGDFAYRMVCSNEMMGMKTINDFMLQGTTPAQLEQLFAHIKEVEQRGFMPYMFGEQLQMANKVNASYREVESAYNIVKKQLSIEDKDLESRFNEALEVKFFEGNINSRQKCMSAGFDVMQLTDKQKSFIDSGMNMWTLINNLTNLGSNNTGFSVKDKATIQKNAGKIFMQEYDLAYSSLMRL